MTTLRITLDSLSNLAGKPVLAVVTMVPTVDHGVTDSAGGFHHALPERSELDGAKPWTYDLVDPTDCDPADWGYVVTIATETNRVVLHLDAGTIAAVEPVNGVRVLRLEEHVPPATTYPLTPTR